MNRLVLMISTILILFFGMFLDVESIFSSTSVTKLCPPGYIIDKNGFCDPESTSNIPDKILMNETENPDNSSINEKPTSDSAEFEAILLAVNGIPPVDSTASANAHFELKNNAAELTVQSFSLEGRELIGIIAVHIHAGIILKMDL